MTTSDAVRALSLRLTVAATLALALLVPFSLLAMLIIGNWAPLHDLDLTVLCVNDDGYGMLRFDEQRRFGRTFAADLMTPDLVSLAAAFDIPYTEVRLGDASLGAAVGRGIEDGGVHLIELRAALYPPRTSSPRWDEPA